MSEWRVFEPGEWVTKVGGDYSFEGNVAASFLKRSGQRRYVVEDDRGILHIFSGKNLEPRLSPEERKRLETVRAEVELLRIEDELPYPLDCLEPYHPAVAKHMRLRREGRHKTTQTMLVGMVVDLADQAAKRAKGH